MAKKDLEMKIERKTNKIKQEIVDKTTFIKPQVVQVEKTKKFKRIHYSGNDKTIQQFISRNYSSTPQIKKEDSGPTKMAIAISKVRTHMKNKSIQEFLR